MGIGHEHIDNWPKSLRMADAVMVTYAVVYTTGEGLAAVWAGNEEARADALTVEYQRRGHRAWYVVLEDDGQLVEAG
jgi:hypothetical protein